MLYPPLKCTGDLDEFIKYASLAELPTPHNLCPLVEEGKMACCSLCSSVQ